LVAYGIKPARPKPMPIGYAEFLSRSHQAAIRVYDEAGNVIETHEHAGEFKEWYKLDWLKSGTIKGAVEVQAERTACFWQSQV
jgi:hypothetical protein